MPSGRPACAGGQANLSSSPFVAPGLHEGYKCVRVDARLYAIEPMAYHFLRGFARDNALSIHEDS